MKTDLIKQTHLTNQNTLVSIKIILKAVYDGARTNKNFQFSKLKFTQKFINGLKVAIIVSGNYATKKPKQKQSEFLYETYKTRKQFWYNCLPNAPFFLAQSHLECLSQTF